MFYFFIGILLVIAAVFIVWPLCVHVFQPKQSKVANTELSLRASTNVALYQKHSDDLTKSFADGSIDEIKYRQLKVELGRNLLNDEEDSGCDSKTKDTINDKVTASWVASSLFIGGLLILPVLAVVIYQYLGVNDTNRQIADQLRYKNQLLHQSTSVNQVALDKVNRELLEKLEDSIKNSPDNTQAWILHARIAGEIRQFDKAINSYQRALEQQPESSQIMAELAQALFIGGGSQLAPVIETLANKALAIDSNNVMALSLMGIMAFNAEKYAKAIEFWQQVSALMEPNTPDAQVLQQGIDQATTNLLISAAGGSNQNNQGSASITVSVSLADNIDFHPEQTVFVYARAWEGSKMPLAIAKLRAGQLPLTIALDESMAMSPSISLNSIKQVELVARLSLSGGSIPKTGDWQVNYGPITLSEEAKTYPLVIDQAVQ